MGTGCCPCMLLLALSMIMPGAVPVVATALAYLVFMFAWNAGYGGLQFVVGLELLPSEVRSIWQGQILFLTGILEIAIYQCFLSALQADGVGTFLFFSFINLLGVVFAALYVPDVTGQSLEQVPKSALAAQHEGPICVNEAMDWHLRRPVQLLAADPVLPFFSNSCMLPLTHSKSLV